MNKVINDAIIPLINAGKISVNKIQGLIEIKEFIDRISTKKYLLEDKDEPFEKIYGERPNLVTWGDFFQTELAMDACVANDEAFDKIVETVKFDVMSSYEIFSSNTKEFYEWVEEFSNEIKNENKNVHNAEEKEIIHLNILRNYYFNMGINGDFTRTELKWYLSFSEEEAVSS